MSWKIVEDTLDDFLGKQTDESYWNFWKNFCINTSKIYSRYNAGIPGGVLARVSEWIPEVIPGDIPADISIEIPREIPYEIAQSVREATLLRIPKGTSGMFPEKKTLAERVSLTIFDRASECGDEPALGWKSQLYRNIKLLDHWRKQWKMPLQCDSLVWHFRRIKPKISFTKKIMEDFLNEFLVNFIKKGRPVEISQGFSWFLLKGYL